MNIVTPPITILGPNAQFPNNLNTCLENIRDITPVLSPACIFLIAFRIGAIPKKLIVFFKRRRFQFLATYAVFFARNQKNGRFSQINSKTGVSTTHLLMSMVIDRSLTYFPSMSKKYDFTSVFTNSASFGYAQFPSPSPGCSSIQSKYYMMYPTSIDFIVRGMQTSQRKPTSQSSSRFGTMLKSSSD